MTYEAVIRADKNPEKIEELFKAEDKSFKDRASYKVKAGEEVKFKIEAEDATALRTALNSISKVLQVYEKTKKS